MNIFGEPHKVRAAIETLDGFSGHADHSELMDWFRRTSGPKKRVWLVHGETLRSNALAAAMLEEWPEHDIRVARLGESADF